MSEIDFEDLKGHDHVFVTGQETQSEKRTVLVIALNAVMMVAEITAGLAFGSMALLADGWHMASHVAALGITWFAYRYARRHIANRRYSWGTGKVGSLAGYTSAVVLGIVALLLGAESFHRLVHPVEIEYGSAVLVAIIGLAVNLFSAWLLGGHGHDHGHGRHGYGHSHGQGHDHDHDYAHTNGGGDAARAHLHHDHNLRAAYFHVLADALTSLLAIFALSAGILFGIVWLDPLMGVIGAAVILWWSFGLLRGASGVLLDEEASSTAADAIRHRLQAGGGRVIDLHLWRVGPAHFALIASIVTPDPRHPDHYKSLLEDFEGLAHVTVEVVPVTSRTL